MTSKPNQLKGNEISQECGVPSSPCDRAGGGLCLVFEEAQHSPIRDACPPIKSGEM